MSDDVLAFLALPGHRARLAEIGGRLCATVIAADFPPEALEPRLERIDVVLQPSDVLVRRRPIHEDCAAVPRESIEREWAQTPPGQRDASVLFLQILDCVIDTSTEVLDEIRRRVGLAEERLLAANPPLNKVLSELLKLSHDLGRVRDGLLPLRGAIRELAELRDPVERNVLSDAGGRWLRSVELDLTHEVTASLQVAEGRIARALQQVQGERSEATNRVVLLLTIITVAFFLPTLITGLYGMNVPLPAQTRGWVFWSTVGVAAFLIAVAAGAITRLGLWGTFRSVLPGPRLSLKGADHEAVVIRRTPVDGSDPPLDAA